ncbi:MAG: OmpA family protein [Panacagrimonas sp.]
MNRANSSWMRAAVLVAAAALPLAVHAQEGDGSLYRNKGPYVGGGIGYNQPGDQEFDFRGTHTFITQPTVPVEPEPIKNTGVAAENEYKGNLFFSGVIGYSFPSGLRPEFELAYRQNDADEVNYPDPTPAIGGREPEGKNVKITGTSGMFNLWYDLFPSSRFHPYLGGGAGFTRFKLQRQPTNQLTQGPFVVNLPVGPLICPFQDCNGPRKSDDAAFSYQAGGGIRWDVADSITIGLDYRYLKAQKSQFFGFRDQQETHLDAEYDTQSLMLSANYYFALPVPPPPPPAEPVAVVPPPAVCSDTLDNDGDGLIDFPADPGCTAADDGDETDPPQCSDGKDNDGDGLIDFPADKGCTAADDNDEVDPCKTPAAGERISLKGCGTGDIIVLRGVNFEFDKARLTVNAKTILDNVGEELTAYPEIEVELGGHTDGKGSDEYNQRLSDKRAASVKTYLVGKDIAESRMSTVGYGESQPVADNETDEGRELNRRVELKVTKGVAAGGPALVTQTAGEPAVVSDAPAGDAGAAVPAAADEAPVAETTPAVVEEAVPAQ